MKNKVIKLSESDLINMINDLVIEEVSKRTKPKSTVKKMTVTESQLREMQDKGAKINSIVKKRITESSEGMVGKAIDKLKSDSSIFKVAEKIYNDEKAMGELKTLLSKLGVNMNESIGFNPEAIALAFINKSGINNVAEDENEHDYTAASSILGFVGGGVLAHYMYSVPALHSVIDGASSAAMGESMVGAFLGAAIGLIGAYIYKKSKEKGDKNRPI